MWVEDKAFRTYLAERGLKRVTSPFKTIPRLESAVEERSFLRGLFDADGSAAKKRPMIRLTSASSVLLAQVKQLLQRFGVVGYLSPTPTPASAHAAWHLCVSGTSYTAFVEGVGFYEKHKREQAQAVASLAQGKTSNDFVPDEDGAIRKCLVALLRASGGVTCQGDMRAKKALRPKHLTWPNFRTLLYVLKERGVTVPGSLRDIERSFWFYDPVTEVSHGDSVPMYDIEVEEDHTFVADGVVVHNSQGSTYDSVFVAEGDVRRSRALQWPLLYVAYSRAKEGIHIWR
jgi:ribonucleoside-diphosphate reductase alpha chain